MRRLACKPTAALAVDKEWKTDLDGALVQVGPFLEDHGMWECYTTSRLEGFEVGDIVLLYSEELVPTNQHTRDYMEFFLKEAGAVPLLAYKDRAEDVMRRHYLEQIRYLDDTLNRLPR